MEFLDTRLGKVFEQKWGDPKDNLIFFDNGRAEPTKNMPKDSCIYHGQSKKKFIHFFH